MSYRLASLHLGTEFDRPVEALPVPGVAGKGDVPALVILDGAARGAVRLARLVRQPSLLGLQVEKPAGPVRVTVTLILDDLSTEMWRAAHDLEPADFRNEHQHHRLVQVSLQGRVRAGVLLDRRGADRGTSVQRISVELSADELGALGLLTLSVDLPATIPSWLSHGLLDQGLTGVCLGRVKVEPVEAGTTRAGLSTGRSPAGPRHLVPRTPGGFVLNPGADRAPVTLAVMPRVLGPRKRPPGRRALVKEPFARVRDVALRMGRARSQRPVDVEVVPLDGAAAYTSQVTPDARGTYRLEVAPASLPAMVRVGSGRTADWYVWVD